MNADVKEQRVFVLDQSELSNNTYAVWNVIISYTVRLMSDGSLVQVISLVQKGISGRLEGEDVWRIGQSTKNYADLLNFDRNDAAKLFEMWYTSRGRNKAAVAEWLHSRFSSTRSIFKKLLF